MKRSSLQLLGMFFPCLQEFVANDGFIDRILFCADFMLRLFERVALFAYKLHIYKCIAWKWLDGIINSCGIASELSLHIGLNNNSG